MDKRMEIGISRVANNGKGVGTAPDGKTVFVTGAVPGDRLLVDVTAERSRLYEACINSVLSPSPDRIEPDCPELDRCGGCCFRQMTYAAELDAKTGFVRDAFCRIGGFDVDCEPIIPSPLNEAYRNKVEFAVGTDSEGKLFPGFYSEKTHQAVPVENCRLISEEFLKIAKRFFNIINIKDNIKENISSKSFKDNRKNTENIENLKVIKKNKLLLSVENKADNSGIFRQLILRKSGLTGEILLCVVTAEHIEKSLSDAAEQIRSAFPSVNSVCMVVNRSSGAVELGEAPRFLSGSRFIRDQICGVPVEIGPLSFFQVNTPAAEALYRTAAEFADIRQDDVMLDLYCGMGTIGLSMAAGCRQLIGGEIVPEAVESAKRNAAVMGLTNTRFFCGDAGEIAQTLIREHIHPSLIILDPPRRGCSPETLRTVLTLDPARIVMVSCDPATAARDCRTLCDAGFTLTRLRPADLFPRTRHVETVVLLSKLKTVPYIDVRLDMDELDLTAAESKASYQRIRDYIHEKYGFNIPNLYIAQVKRKLGLEVGVNYNHSKKDFHRVPQCPAEKEAAIIDALKYFKMLK